MRSTYTYIHFYIQRKSKSLCNLINFKQSKAIKNVKHSKRRNMLRRFSFACLLIPNKKLSRFDQGQEKRESFLFLFPCYKIYENICCRLQRHGWNFFNLHSWNRRFHSLPSQTSLISCIRRISILSNFKLKACLHMHVLNPRKARENLLLLFQPLHNIFSSFNFIHFFLSVSYSLTTMAIFQTMFHETFQILNILFESY